MGVFIWNEESAALLMSQRCDWSYTLTHLQADVQQIQCLTRSRFGLKCFLQWLYSATHTVQVIVFFEFRGQEVRKHILSKILGF